MKSTYHLYYILSAGLMVITGCKQSYNPPSINANKNYLVVDGFINAGADSTIFTLGRTSNLDSPASPNSELGATLVVQGSGGYSFQLSELGNGRYGASGLNLDLSQNYRLSIATTNGSAYLSDYSAVKSSPPMDSVSWQLIDGGVNIYANTHDPLGNTRYYRWDYVETWENRSHYESFYHYDPSTRSIYIGQEVPHICWSNDNSTNILIASSAKLTSDIIYRAPLTFIPLNSIKISVEYSILVRQYALTAEEYNYWQTLQSSTEKTGSLFDQQPLQITGNIHCTTNPNELAIGYVGAGSVVESQRIFINNYQVAPWFYEDGCQEVLVSPDPDSLQFYNSFGFDPVDVKTMGGAIIAYYFSDNHCVDCTLNGGTNIKPGFWQ
ncbi:MAG TPA: DUF4249 domain-containing protein [Puia sp.]|jgi:hypothetical protein|nr:DUF4249 domain-containing protein [Puia sp.]